MKSRITLKHEFVKFIPNILKDKTIYISIPYATAAHKCCCGCGQEIITPISPTDWKLIFDGKSISLYPSIGNWGLPCQSHYWIERNEVKWAPRWSKNKINAARAYDAFNKEEHFSNERRQNSHNEYENPEVKLTKDKKKKSFWHKLKEW
jgi:hypothetical protein